MSTIVPVGIRAAIGVIAYVSTTISFYGITRHIDDYDKDLRKMVNGFGMMCITVWAIVAIVCFCLMK